MATQAQLDILQSSRAIISLLAEFEFSTGAIRTWHGDRELTTADSKVWTPLYGLGSIESVNMSADMTAEEIVFALPVGFTTQNGEFYKLDADDIQSDLNADVADRSVNLYLQPFGDNFLPVDNPIPLNRFYMSHMDYNQGANTMNLRLHAENFWRFRNKKGSGRLTNQDQQNRFSGDRGLEYMAELKNKTINWPQS